MPNKNFLNVPLKLAVTVMAVLALAIAGCGDDDRAAAASGLSGSVAIDGSSTVYPFAQAAAESFNGENPDVQGHGRRVRHRRRLREVLRRRDRHLERLAPDQGRRDRRLQEERHRVHRGPGRQRRHLGRHQPGARSQVPDHRRAQAALEQGLEGHELQRGRHRRRCPTPTLSLYGPGTDSGTFDYFTDEINGEEGVSRKRLPALRGRQRARPGRRRRRRRTRLLRLLLLRAERGQAEPRRGRRRRRLRRAEQGDDPGRHLHAALAPAVHVRPNKAAHRAPRSRRS